MAEYIVFRFLNLYYYLFIFIYALIIFLHLIILRKNKEYKNGLIIFILTSTILTAMEFYGTFSGIRTFYIGGEINLQMQLFLQLIMGIGEGGTMATLTYLVIEKIYERNYIQGFLYMGSFALLMTIIALITLINDTNSSSFLNLAEILFWR